MLSLLTDLDGLLRTRRFGRAARGFEVLPSTNTEAAAWAMDGAPEGALVVADHQTAGRGRLGRRWEADPGQNLLVSLVLRPPLLPERLGLVTLAGGVAVAEAVEAAVPPLRPRLKWPNDLLLDGKKCCGMLLESRFGPDAYVVLGIGLNVNQTVFPDGFIAPPTSLRLEAGRPVERAPLLAALLEHLEAHYDRLLTGQEADVRRAFEARMVGLGAPARVQLAAGGEALDGLILGLDDTGALRLATDTGIQTLHAGEVSFRPDALS